MLVASTLHNTTASCIYRLNLKPCLSLRLTDSSPLLQLLANIQHKTGQNSGFMKLVYISVGEALV